MTCDGQNLHPMDAMGGDCVLHKLHLVMCLRGNYANGNHGFGGGGEEGMGLKFEMVISDIDKYRVMKKLKL